MPLPATSIPPPRDTRCSPKRFWPPSAVISAQDYRSLYATSPPTIRPEHPETPMPDLQEQFGEIDIYLFDQLLRGRIAPGMKVLDAGCGSGRNLIYLLRAGCEVFAVDSDTHAV